MLYHLLYQEYRLRKLKFILAITILRPSPGDISTAWNVQIWSFSGLHFPVFGLNSEVYGVNLRNHSECRRIRTRKKSIFEHFSRSDLYGHSWEKNISLGNCGHSCPCFATLLHPPLSPTFDTSIWLDQIYIFFPSINKRSLSSTLIFTGFIAGFTSCDSPDMFPLLLSLLTSCCCRDFCVYCC